MEKINPKFTILLPTFNESRNIDYILKSIRAAIMYFPHTYEILFIDDSNDETPRVILDAKEKYGNVRLLHRPKEERTGLATALIAGFREARGEYICSLDSDLQHPPRMIPILAKKIIDEKSDIVVATRYMENGSADGLGSKYRKLISKFCRLVSWTMLAPTRKSTDPGSGFFAVRKELVDNISFHSIYGFKILMDILTRAPSAKISEIPYSFEKRNGNESKATFKQGLQFFRHVWNLFMDFRLPIYVKRILTFIVVAALILAMIATIKMADSKVGAVVLTIAVFLVIQGTFTLFLMTYAWENPGRVKRNRSPEKFKKPKYSFTAIIPARKEEKVIADTIEDIANINYPDDMKELVVLINENDDAETIRIAREKIESIGKPNVRLVTFTGPLGKSVSLNIGLKNSTKDVVTIFDAEDDVHADIYNIVNTVMIRDKADVVQSGVQLMNYGSNWYSLFNVLEYYFWFKSALHFFAKNNMIPLGGNTVFFKKNLILGTGGWDAKSLTEDADIGLKMSVAGAKIRVVYDELHATREKTPPTLWGFIKQRTRWNQGFIQILFSGHWLKLPTMKQKFLALYVFSWPIFQGLLFILIPFSFIMALKVKMIPVLGIISNVPLYVLFFLIVVLNVGIYEFTKNYSIKYSLGLVMKSIIFFIPYQLVLGMSAFRAISRQLLGNNDWEKTAHINLRNDNEGIIKQPSVMRIIKIKK